METRSRLFCGTLQALVVCSIVFLFKGNADAQLAFPRNSTQKIRNNLSDQAARIGSAVNWKNDWEAAFQQAKNTGKPVFWYVPTLRGSFMDRVDSIDRYMLAGPFSWPDIISVLNEHTVPLKAKPTLNHQRQYGVQPYVFVEPGFLLLNPDGELRLKLDRLTTLHPEWIRHQILAAIDLGTRVDPAKEMPGGKDATSEVLDRAWEKFRNRQYETAGFVPGEDLGPHLHHRQAEAWLLSGMFDFRRGNHEAAKEKWIRASRVQPEHPLAWKAAAEAEGFGPFVRGFEVHGNLPEQVVSVTPPRRGSSAPPDVWKESEIWRAATEFLIGMQDSDGGFKDSDYDFGGTDSLPNVHVAVTSLAGMALLESGQHLENDSKLLAKINRAVNLAASYVADDRNLNFDDRDELIWAQAYRIRFLSRLAKKPKLNGTDESKLDRLVQQIESLQSRSGSWFHEYNNAFVSATVLLALEEAIRAGAKHDVVVLDRGVRSLSGERRLDGAFPYLEQPPGKGGESQVTLSESAGRMPICELALWRHGRASDASLLSAIEISIEKNQLMESALKYDDHTSSLNYGGFFFWFDVWGRGEAIAAIKDPANRRRLQQNHRKWILGFSEIDGCFVDSHELGRVYGTAMALLSLSESDR